MIKFRYPFSYITAGVVLRQALIYYIRGTYASPKRDRFNMTQSSDLPRQGAINRYLTHLQQSRSPTTFHIDEAWLIS